jgi:membrane-bound lytic murein transglycosylase B
MIPARASASPTSRRRVLAAALLAAAGGAFAQATPLEPIVAPAPAIVPTTGDDTPADATAVAQAQPHRKAPARSKKKPAAARDDDAPDSFVYGRREDVLAFAAQVAVDRGLDRDWVEAQLAKARYQPSVARLIMPAPAGSAKNYAAYRARFIEPQRLRAGVQWWEAHAGELEEAERRWGVPPELVAGILGIETFYGRMTGGYRVLDALATLSFDFPRGRSDRSDFYRGELRAFLVWCALENREADSVRGSFAGAIGWPQFMPSNLLRLAVDFDHDGHVDLAGGGADVVGSVASYLASFGWQRDVPTHFRVLPPLDPQARAQLLAPDIVPSFTAAQMTALGADLPDDARGYPGLLALIELQNGPEPPSYVAGTANFYVVTRYNWSSYYAMAVIDLAAALKREKALGVAARTR